MTEPTTTTGDVLLQLADRLRENQVFGPTIQRGGVTVLPVASVRAGGGLGGAAHREPNGANGGFGFVARPAGAWIVADSGAVNWQPAATITRAALRGRLATTAALILLAVANHRRADGRRSRVLPNRRPVRRNGWS